MSPTNVFKPDVTLRTLAGGESTIWYLRYHFGEVHDRYYDMTSDCIYQMSKTDTKLVMFDKYADSSRLFQAVCDFCLMSMHLLVLLFLRFPYLCWLLTQPNSKNFLARKRVKTRTDVEYEWECRGRNRAVTESMQDAYRRLHG